MTRLRSRSWILGCCLMASVSQTLAEETPALYPRLVAYVEARVGEFEKIPAERVKTLEKLSRYVGVQTAKGSDAALTFICTHNSRRSHLSQIWAATAAAYYGLDGVATFSGGTEKTAFNPRAVAAVRRAGFEVAVPVSGENPRYEIRCGEGIPPQLCFSKVYDQSPNPAKDFCAVMTCAEADRACPLVEGATIRISLPFEDPKSADDTPAEKRKYDERCAQIAREMLYAFSLVADEGAAK